MYEVEIGTRSLRRLAPVIGAEAASMLTGRVTGTALEALGERSVHNVNSTGAGGGVAEMLRVVLGYARDAGVDARWFAIEGDPSFFEVTKRIHNHLYGTPGDGGPLGAAEHDVYERVQAQQAVQLTSFVRPGDIVILHDPQVAGMAEAVRTAGARLAWRCHVGIDEQNEHSRLAWDFLRPAPKGGSWERVPTRCRSWCGSFVKKPRSSEEVPCRTF